MESLNPPAARVLVAASGTGGHLFPAAFIMRALREQSAQSQIEFVGSGRDLEVKIIGPTGAKRHVLDIVGVKNRGLSGLVEFLRKLPAAWRSCGELLDQIQPQVVIGVGGYVTVLPVIRARLRGIPSWIHEAERRPGLANWLLCFFATKISVAFEDAVIPTMAKRVVTGQPVRPDILAVEEHVQDSFPPFRILVMGGSQGAKPVDALFSRLAPWLAERRFEILHQARGESVPMLKEAYAAAKVDARVVEFIDDMADAYRWAHLVVARSGAGTIMELGVVNRPAILIPYPHAQGNHQLVNAKLLADQGKALIVEEGGDDSNRLKYAIDSLTKASEYDAMRKRPALNRSKTAAADIARGALGLVKPAA